MHFKRNKQKIFNSIVLVIVITVLGLFSTFFPYGSAEEEVYAQNVLDGEKIYTHFSTHAKGEGKRMEFSPGEESFEYGILNEMGKVEVGYTYKLEEGEIFSKFISIINNMGADWCYTLIVFDNYRQIPFFVEGKELVTCSVKVQNGGSVQVPIEIHDFEKGKNELMFVWIVNTNEDLTKSEWDYTNWANAAYLRCDVCVENEDDIWLEPSDRWEYFDDLHCDVNIQGTYGEDMMEVDKIVLEEGNDTVYVTAGNYEDATIKRVVVVLKDFQQIDIGEQPFVYLEIPPQKFVSLPVSLGINDKNPHEVLAIVMNASEDNMFGTAFSNRVVIDGKESYNGKMLKKSKWK